MFQRFGITCFLLLLLSKAICQLCDDFSDGDFLMNPSWEGDTELFRINDQFQLQLNAPTSGESYLTVPVEMEDNAQWEFFIRLDFAPSTSNQLRVYLVSDDPKLSTGNAYFIEIGASGSTDPLRLLHRVEGVETLLAESAPGIVASEPVIATIKVTFVDQVWSTFAALGGGEPTLLFDIAEDSPEVAGSKYFGFHCKFSETRKDRFFFDDICIGPFVPDTIPPIWTSLNIIDAQTLELGFNEILHVSSLASENFILNPGNIQPASVDQVGLNLFLNFTEEFVNNTNYTLGITNLSDTLGNSRMSLEMSFDYFKIEEAESGDILINEIMADPNPPISLPESEYIELYQNGLLTYRLNDYELTIGSKTVELPDLMFLPDEYVIICDEVDTSMFGSFGEVIGIPGMPSLTNSGTTIRLTDLSNNLIHEINYDTDWYIDPNKDDGGWSLELINPLRICANDENWRASEDLSGGTPGAVNSVLETEPDVAGPRLLDVLPTDNNKLVLKFDEALQQDNVDLDDFQIEPPVTLGFGSLTEPNEITLVFTEAFNASVAYQLQIVKISDCLGNEAINLNATFGIPESIHEGDLVINEILFNPATGGARFVELVNVSDKILKTNDIVIGELNAFETDLEAVFFEKLIFPGQLMVFTPDRQDILNRYHVPNPENLIKNNLPGWDNERGNVTILSSGVVVDSFSYNEDWHNPVIDDVNGVSLEKVHANAPSTVPGSWHSAASTDGYATPTGENSQFILLESPDKPFSFLSTTFSPDQDGFEDFLVISFTSELVDATATINIYDSMGRLVRQLVRNETISTNVLFQWDGTNHEGEVQRVGTYIVAIEIFNSGGDTENFKEVCVLAQKL